MDSLSALLNIAAVAACWENWSQKYLIPDVKDSIDYFMIAVLCICWLRFFTYFLVIRGISKLLLTLLAMIGDTLNFMFIAVLLLIDHGLCLYNSLSNTGTQRNMDH